MSETKESTRANIPRDLSDDYSLAIEYKKLEIYFTLDGWDNDAIQRAKDRECLCQSPIHARFGRDCSECCYAQGPTSYSDPDVICYCPRCQYYWPEFDDIDVDAHIDEDEDHAY